MNENGQPQSNWSNIHLEKRIEILKLLLSAFEEQKDLISTTITNEIGKPTSQTRSEVEFFNSFNHWTLDNAQSILSEKVIYEDEKSIHKLTYEPIGKAALILPWNSPYGLFSWKLFANLVVGNTVIIKHSELCPKLVELLKSTVSNVHFPIGTIEFLIGGDHVGGGLVKSDINLICFTGSSKTGEKIYNAPKK